MTKIIPKISIISPVLNVEPYIAEMIESILKQTFQDWELLVMDGVSRDRTVEIARSYADKDKRIKIFSEKDESPWHAVDKGLSKVQGEFITIVCGQDGLHDPAWLKRCIEVFDRDRAVSLVWGVNISKTPEGQLFSQVHESYSHLMEPEPAIRSFWNVSRKAVRTVGELIFGSSQRRAYLLQKIFSPAARLRWNHLLKRSFNKREAPQKEEWFRYWLDTGLVFPDQSMVISKRVFLECTPPYQMGSKTTGHLTDFYFNFHAQGYLSYYLPIIASFGRFHKDQSGEVARREMHEKSEKYFSQIMELRQRILQQHQPMIFRDRAGRPIATKNF